MLFDAVIVIEIAILRVRGRFNGLTIGWSSFIQAPFVTRASGYDAMHQEFLPGGGARRGVNASRTRMREWCGFELAT